MDKKQKEAGCNQRFVRNTVRQGDVVLVNFGRRSKGSRSLSGNRPVYVLSRQMKDAYGSAVLVIPLFRQEPREGCGNHSGCLQGAKIFGICAADEYEED